MTVHSFLHKGALLLFVTNVLFCLVAIPSPVAGDDDWSDLVESIFSSVRKCPNNGSCPYYSPTCTNPSVRKEWYTLSNDEKEDYFDAVFCLYHKPSLPAIHSQFPGTINRLDDFTAVHANQTPYIHGVGQFFLWHRYLIALYEKALRTECGYDGGVPYWNLAKDLGSGKNMMDWGIFDNTHGFGGNGPYASHVGAPNPFNITGCTGGGCVPGGRFGTGSTFKVNLGPGPSIYTSNPTCLKRDFSPPTLAYCTQSYVDALLSQPNFPSFTEMVDFSPAANRIQGIHPFGHVGLGGQLGQVGDVYCSPSDPIFYMHHGNLERIYWQWQLRNPIVRLCEVGGPVIPQDYGLTKGPAVTLDFIINLNVLAPPIRIADLLSSVAGPLCYVYDRLV